jgi:molybdenum cofactor cytidylyltransferase
MNSGGAIAALILAAGNSSRLGTFKPLLPLGHTTVIGEAVQRFQAAGVDDIRVVTGNRAEELAPVLQELGVREIFNPNYDRGMLASVRAGVNSLEPGIVAFFLLPVDIPLVKPRTITDLLHAYRHARSRLIYPNFQGLRGHPPLIALDCVVGLPTDWQGGLQAFLSRCDHDALDLQVMDEAVILDCDTPEDYRRLRHYEARQDFPNRRECEALWDQHKLPEKVRRHCCLVAGLAGILANHLNCAGQQLNIALAISAGYLHDLAKGQPNHAGEGARFLEGMGYRRVARIVAAHRDIELQERSMGESELVYLADKISNGVHLVSLEERFQQALDKFGDQPEIKPAIIKRFQNALLIKNRLEDVLEISLEELLRRYARSLQPAAAAGSRRIYLARHGAVATAGTGRRYLGHLDVPLSTAGLCQAEALREKLRHVPLAAVYCSDLRRSIVMADIIAAPHGLKPDARGAFREIALGAWEGLSFDEVKESYPEEYAARGRDFIHFRPPGGESFLDCANRVLPAIFEVLSVSSGDLLIIGHAGINRLLLGLAQGRSPINLFAIPQDYGCLNVLAYREFEFALESLNETSTI